MAFTVATVDAVLRVAGSSLIGASGDPPISWGNYWQARIADHGDSVPVLNMWLENYQHAAKTFCEGVVKVRIYKHEADRWCLVCDPRIPADYYYNKLCFRGARRPPIEVAEDIYKFIGDPNNELERFTDPVAYHGKRGDKYDPETGYVSSSPEIRERMAEKYGRELFPDQWKKSSYIATVTSTRWKWQQAAVSVHTDVK